MTMKSFGFSLSSCSIQGNKTGHYVVILSMLELLEIGCRLLNDAATIISLWQIDAS